MATDGKFGRRRSNGEVTQDTGLAKPHFAVIGCLYGKEALMYDMPESVYDARAIEVNARGQFMLEGVKCRAGSERCTSFGARVAANRFK